MDFHYHRSVAPMLWVLVAIAVVELVVVHLLLLLWLGRLAALAASLFVLAGIIWLVRLIASFRRLPVRIEAGRVIMRVGTFKRVDLPLQTITGLRRAWDAKGLKERSVLKLSLIAYPNVVVDLTSPLPGRRGITAVAHRLDDPAAFAAALAALGVGHVG